MTRFKRSAMTKQIPARGMTRYRPSVERLEDRVNPIVMHWIGSPAGDGQVNTTDNLQFRNRFNRPLSWSA